MRFPDRRTGRREGGLTVMDCMIDGYSLRVHTPVPYSVPLEPGMPFTAMMAAAIRASRDTGEPGYGRTLHDRG